MSTVDEDDIDDTLLADETDSVPGTVADHIRGQRMVFQHEATVPIQYPVFPRRIDAVALVPELDSTAEANHRVGLGAIKESSSGPFVTERAIVEGQKSTGVKGIPAMTRRGPE